ncbi:MAG TPA: MFS transporter, partial [Dehalococcoidia bacterium]|nr:MFS transporter [Dehalococcoidia bacterium]
TLPLGGWLTDRFGRLPPLLGGAGAAALAFAMLTHLDRPWQGSIAAVFGVAGLALTMPAATVALVDEAQPGHRGLLFGGMMAAQGLAEAIGPFIGGLLLTLGGAATPFAAAAVAIWLAIPLSVLYASAPRGGRPGVVVGYTPFTRALSRMSIRAHAWYLARSNIGGNATATAIDREVRDR